MPPVFNVVLFGETGSGKSSIINMVAENPNLATISSGSTGCTFTSQQFSVEIMGIPFFIYDTAGLNEGEGGRVPEQEAIVQLYKLICNLSEGVSLLIFCMRGPRLKDGAHKNWRLFHEIICQNQVPTVVAITGLENEESMDSWWTINKGAFQRYQMNPSGVACITATRGKLRSSGYTLEDEFRESKRKMWRLIRNHHLEEPWRVEKTKWFRTIVETTVITEWCFTREIHEEHRADEAVIGQLVERCDMSHEEARALAEQLNATA